MGAAAKIHLLKREKNQKAIQNADLIIIESNLIENTNSTPIEISIRNTHWLFEELYFLYKKILILILPLNSSERVDKTNLVYEKLSYKYGFNLINMQKVYKDLNVLEFWQDKYDPFHEINAIMHTISKNIINHIDKMQMPRKLEISKQNPEFKICKAYEMQGAEEILTKKDFFHNEKVVHLKEGQRLKFDESAAGFYLFTIGTCNISKSNNKRRDIFQDLYHAYSSVVFTNSKEEFVKAVGLIHEINEIWHKFKLDTTSYLMINTQNKAWSEASRHTILRNNIYRTLDYTDVTEISLAKGGRWDFADFDYESIKKTGFEKYDFDHLVPDMGFLTEVVKEFNERKDPFKFGCLNSQITNLKAEIQGLKNKLHSLPSKISEQELANLKLDEKIKKLEIKKLEKDLGLKLSKLEPRVNLILNENLRTSAVTRIRNHLAYRLGAAIIVCNKSLFGICGLPFVLSFIKANYKKEQSAYKALIKQRPELKLPNLETYPDYQAALKEKACLTYKLGEAMMRADKAWYKGGYVKFYFEAKRLEKEFKNKKD